MTEKNQTDTPTNKQKRTWTVTINEVPFKSKKQKDLSYTAWIESLFPPKE